MSPAVKCNGEALGYRWRSSKVFIVIVVSVAMFADQFLFTFIVPIIGDILEKRVHQPSSRTQTLTSIILSLNAFVSIASAPLLGHYADKSRYRNRLLILAWVVEIVGTAVTALSTTLYGLIIGRVIQTIGGISLWVIGMAVLSFAAGPQNLAKTISFVALFMSAGLLSGPAIAGSLYELASYTATWLSAFVVLAVGILLQMLMIERSHNGHKPGEVEEDIESVKKRDEEERLGASSTTSKPPESDPAGDRDYDMVNDESSPLLNRPTSPSSHMTAYHSTAQTNRQVSPTRESNGSKKTIRVNFYWLMLCRGHVSISVIADIIFAMVISSFEATIPLHTLDVFGWKSLQTGLLFLLIQVPALILLTPAGWLKDKIGQRLPVSVAFVMMAPCLWLLGVPGKGGLDWANRGHAGPAIFIVALVGIGIFRTFLMGYGTIEAIVGCKQLEAEYPGAFGRNGGSSQAFALTMIAYKIGMLLGPLVSGALTETIGYYYMNTIFGILCFIIGVATYFVLRKK